MASALTFGQNSARVFAAQVATTLALAATAIVTARALGPEGRGAYALATIAPALVFALANMGLPSATTFFVAQRRHRSVEVVTASLFTSGVLGVASALVAGALFLTVAHAAVRGLTTTQLVISLAAVPFLFLAATVQAVILGKQRYGAYGVVTLVQAAGVLVLILPALFLTHRPVTGAIALTTVAVAAISLVTLWWCRRLVPGSVRPSRKFVLESWRYGLQSHLGNVMSFVGYRADIFLVAAYANIKAVGLYSVAVATAERAWILSTVASTVLFSRQAGERDEAKRKELTPRIARTVLWGTGLGSVILVLLARPLTELLFSRSFDAAVPVLRALMPGIVLYSAGRVLANDLAARGKPAINGAIAGVAAVINVAANILLIPLYGATGAAWASSISYALLFLLALACYRWISGNTMREILVPKWSDVALLTRASALALVPRIALGGRRAGAVKECRAKAAPDVMWSATDASE